ncbi:porin family protein [Pseudooctadecabacter jejudonensis]|uniref:Uncharacterized protein n=1 Tax=Pseudooctadecabacter jejudonensis TaxID=1391910 RepID=A0A1Y5S1R7_9RHOB|nr:hypothetical protein [Pseudooctadecabacter jejudonensis]SLN30616.1 hypothetical protein PSJ8397_01394 [Pseudooctadecabacter jejudonensis]
MVQFMSSRLPLRAVLLGSCVTFATPIIAQEGAGFLITINGAPTAGDASIQQQVRRPDAQLDQADVRIQYDGLTATPVLDLEIEGPVGPSVTLQSAMNYPAYVTRGEIRLYDTSGAGAPRLVATRPIAPNGTTTVQVPDGDIYATHRVYDARGRYDETAPLSLNRADSRLRADGVEDGTDATARRGIPVHGGAVTVSGSSVPQGARVQTMGEVIRPDASGRFAVQRILPAGAHPVGVQVTGAGQNVDLVRDITVPRADWFYVATADLTYGTRRSDGVTETYSEGRAAGYVNGHFANGVQLTAQIDTGVGPLEDLLSDLDERDPRSVLLRIDPDDLYPTYGDDSTIVDDTPTQGRIYLRVERDNNFLLWGNYQAQVQGGYLRNERTLYGLTGHYETSDVTSEGAPRASVDLYSAQPERLAQRDVLIGTGGAVYFLNRSDIGIGSETISVQVRDASTGRVLETRELVAGQDYSINYIQGVVTLSAPLSSYGGTDGVIVTAPGGNTETALIAQYEYSPTAQDVDTFAYGGRAEAWVTDDIRIGVTAMSEDNGTGDDQQAIGVDLLWQPSPTAYVSLDYARSEGPGFTSSISSDGGLVFDTQTDAGGTGEAYRLEAGANLSDLGLSAEGAIATYFEKRTEGFSTLDYDIDADETLWGVALDAQVSDRLSIAAAYDDLTSDAGDIEREGTVEVSYALNPALTLAAGLGYTDRDDGTEIGTRTDAAVRLTYAPSDDLTVFGYVQSTLDRSGTIEANDRVGLGGSYAFADTWTVEGEVSDGDQGTGARIVFRQERGEQDSTYFGYELDPDRDIAGVDLVGNDDGRLIFGGSRDLGGGWSTYGENTYDMFGAHRSLTSAYGVSYEVSDYLTYTASVEFGQVRDDVNGDYERRGLGLGMAYQDASTTASARLEYRTDDGTLSGSDRDSETVLLVADVAHKIDEERRLIFRLDAATTSGDGTIVESGDLIDAQLGYAYRPIDNERLNMLFRYRYLEDTYGQQLDNSDTPGSLQRSHVLSFDASYDLNEEWTLGGKIGVRLSETAPDAATAFTENNAALLVANARYHFLHNWDALVEVRAMRFDQTETTEFGALGAVYRNLGPNVKLGVGYNFGTVSSDLTDIDFDEGGSFINLVAQF